jgi:hypothetical protein
MTTSTQFRQFAEDCLRLAGETKNLQERELLQKMAETWTKLAKEAERKSSKPPT